jgi:hypothetical protein
MNYREELKKLEYKQSFLQGELTVVENQIKYINDKIQECCVHDTIKAYRDYDGHKTQIDYFCKDCHKSFELKELTNSKIEYY